MGEGGYRQFKIDYRMMITVWSEGSDQDDDTLRSRFGSRGDTAKCAGVCFIDASSWLAFSSSWRRSKAEKI